jgi:hypothetical protein
MTAGEASPQDPVTTSFRPKASAKRSSRGRDRHPRRAGTRTLAELRVSSQVIATGAPGRHLEVVGQGEDDPGTLNRRAVVAAQQRSVRLGLHVFASRGQGDGREQGDRAMAEPVQVARENDVGRVLVPVEEAHGASHVEHGRGLLKGLAQLHGGPRLEGAQ